jgi:hypothetical protein
MRLIYIKAFQARHTLFDDAFIGMVEREVVIYDASPFYILSCIRAIARSWYHRKDIVIFGVFSNWMLPFCPTKRTYFVAHNNCERRFRLLLRRAQNILYVSKNQNVENTCGIFIGHPLPVIEVESGLMRNVNVLITDRVEVLEICKNSGFDNLIIKGELGVELLDDLEGTFKRAKSVIIDRDYKMRVSSLAATALSCGATTYVLDDMSAKNLNESFGIDAIRNLRGCRTAEALDVDDIIKVNSEFKMRILRVLG